MGGHAVPAAGHRFPRATRVPNEPDDQRQVGPGQAEPLQGRRALLYVLHERGGRLATGSRGRTVS